MKPESLTRLFLRRIQKDKKDESGCWLWLGERNSSGYGVFVFRRDGTRHRWLAHRAAYELFNGPVSDHLQVKHSCDNKLCVNPKHLSVGTQRENEAEKVARGRSSRGEDRWCATLTNQQAQEMLDRHLAGESIPDLVKAYNVRYWVVYSVCTRRRWKYLIP